MSQLQEEMIDAEQSGWAELPRCSYLLIGDDGKLHCSYNYSKQLKKAHDTLPLGVVRDVGLDDGVNEAFCEGKIREKCSPVYCPSPTD